MRKPERLINREAINEDGVKGVIRFWDKKREKFIGHRADNNARYWESVNPQLLIPIDDEE